MNPLKALLSFLNKPREADWSENLDEHAEQIGFDEIYKAIERKDAERAKLIPDEKAALLHMQEAYYRLKELGWSDAIYCPKDGTMFSAIEAGSTGVHQCNYTGEWPKGSWWVYDGDMWPSRPILWRPRKDEDSVIDHGLAMDYKCEKQPSECARKKK